MNDCYSQVTSLGNEFRQKQSVLTLMLDAELHSLLGNAKHTIPHTHIHTHTRAHTHTHTHAQCTPTHIGTRTHTHTHKTHHMKSAVANA